MRDRFIQTLCQIAEKDPRIMLITGDLGFAVLDEYRRRDSRASSSMRAWPNRT